MRRPESDTGSYRRLNQRCWAARLADDLPTLLDLADDPALSPDMVATIAPLASQDGDPDLIHRVLSHPACGEGVASRYATHPDRAIRLRVAGFPGLITSTLAILAVDRDPAVRATAIGALTERASGSSPTGPPV